MVESSSKLLKLEKLVGGAENYQEWRMRTLQKLKGLNKIRFVSAYPEAQDYTEAKWDKYCR